MAKLRVGLSFLKTALNFPIGTEIVGATFVDDGAFPRIELELSGPDVPHCEEVAATIHVKTTTFSPVEHLGGG